MFLVTTTRFIATLAMTLLLWLTSSTAAVASDPLNPDPCLLPYDCIKPPVLSGVISGPTVVCIGVPGTWTLNESFTSGLKQKCEETAIDVTKKSSEWVWNYNGGPEPMLGYHLGTTFTATFTQEGTYTIYWNGIATLSDSVCDYVGSKVEMTFTVVSPTPKAVLTSIVTKPDSICLDEESDGICTIGDQSPCDAGPYTVKWKVESDGGPQNLQFTPSSGQVALTFGQSVDITFKIKAGAGAKGGTAKYKLTATVNGVDQTSSGQVTVNDSTPKAELTSIVIKPDPMCIDEESDGICTIDDQSPCDAGPYTVKWKVESDGGPQNLQFTPSSGEVSLAFMQSADIKFKVKAGAGAKGGTAAITFTATVNGVDQASGGTVSIFNPLSITHNKPVIKKWVSGENAQAKLTYEGSINGAKIVYWLYNVDTSEIQWTQTSSETTISVPIAKAGRYIIQAQCCNRIFTASPTFICYTVKVEGDLNYEWDKDDRLKQVFSKADSSLETISANTDKSLKVKDACEAKGQAAEANVKAAKTRIEGSISSCDGFSLEMSRKIQLKARELEANAAEQIRRKADMEKVQAQLAQIEQRLRELENQPNPSPKTIEKIKVLRLEQDAAQGLKTVIANDINQLVSKSFQISQDLAEMKVVRGEIQLTKEALNQALLDEKAAFAKDGKLTAPKVTEAKAIHETLKTRVAGMGTTMAKFAWAKGLPALGITIDVINWSQFDDKRQELEDYLTELDRLTREHKTLLDNLKVDRVLPPLKKSLTVTTQPGGIPFKLAEEPYEPWLTQDSFISGMDTEYEWGWFHLILLRGDEMNYVFRQSTENGVTGKWVGEFWAFGNLNSSYLTARVDIGPSNFSMWGMQARSTGATENKMITLAEAKGKEYAAKWKEIDRKMEVISTALSLGLGLGAIALLIVGSALAAPVAIAAAIVGALKLFYDFAWWLLYDTELMKSIKYHYPKEN